MGSYISLGDAKDQHPVPPILAFFCTKSQTLTGGGIIPDGREKRKRKARKYPESLHLAVTNA
jgi:hypothetical protein